MARNTNRVSVQGDILLKAKLQLDGATSQIDQLTKKLGTMKLSDKATKNLTAGFERINELLPNLQKQLAKGILNDEEMTIYLADTKRLTKELTKMSNTMRAMPNIAIEVDSPKLKQLTAGVESLRDKIKTTQQDFKLDAIGFPNATKEIASLTKQMKTAANAGKSVTEVYNNYSNSMKGVADILRGNTAILEQDSIASELHVENLTKQVALYERVAAALRSQRVGFSPEASAGLDEVKIASPEVRSLVSGVRGNEKKAVIMDNAAKAAADALKQSRIEATAATNAFEESTNKLTIAETKYNEVVAFGAKNEPDMTAFDTRIAALVKSVVTLEGKVKALNEELKQLEQAKLGQGAKDLDDISNAVRNTTIGIKDLTDAEKAEAAATAKSVDAFKSKIAQMFGLYNVYQLVRRGIRQAYASIKELDSAMNAIAVVTSMTTDELWGQIETYMTVAQQYGVTTKGVYEVSKLYYQQGRASSEVTLLTAETLKMAKIAGLDYSKATDNMTVALNGFKIAAEEANQIVDVYAQLAATSAVSTEELAYAMSKTASIAASSGMSFKNTSVFLAQMIQTTREAPENIGTALKTIIARFSEMKKSPLELVNVEGEEVSFNRVDKALQTVGVSLKDASGQFADLDGIIYELANKWDTLDRNTQRYIATTVAGSRQQSRFLALMQDAKGLQELREEAESSEDAGLIQYAKTLDSIETKLNQLSTSFQQLYMSIINGPVVKWFLSAAKDIVDIFKDIPPTLLLFILPAITLIIKTFLTTTVTAIITAYRGADVKILAGTKARLATEESMTLKMLTRIGAARVAANAGGDASKIAAAAAGASTAGLDVATAGAGVTGVLKPIFTKLGTMLGALLKTLAPALAVAAGAAIAIAIADAIRQTRWKTPQERVAQHEKTLEKTNIERAAAKKDLRDLVNLKKKHDALNKVKNTSNEKQQEWIALNNEIAEKYPELISYMDDEGNYVVKLARGYDSLRESKERAYSQAALEDAQAKIKAFSDPAYVYKDMPTGGLKAGNSSLMDYVIGGFDLLWKNIYQDLTHPFTRNETIWTNDSTTERYLGEIVDAAGRSSTKEDFIKNVAPSLPLENKDPAYIKDLLDQGFVPQVGVNNWTESMVTRYKAFMNVYSSWEYKVETLNREMENIYSSMYDDFMYSQDITVESSILSGRVEKGLAEQYKTWEEQRGQDAAISMMFKQRDTIIEGILADVDYSSYDRNTKNLKKAENIRLAEAADTGGILSRQAVYNLRSNPSVVDLLGPEGMTEAEEAADKILLDFVNGYIQVLASADMRKLDSDNTAEMLELTKIFNTLPASMNDFVLASIEDIVNLDASLEDSSLLARTDKEALVKTFSELAVDIGDKTGEDGDEIRAILQRTDPTTALGWAEAAYEIGKLDEDLGEHAKKIGEGFRVTRIDQLAIVDKYQDAMGRLSDAVIKGLDFKQVLQWIEDGTFVVSDFNKTFTGFSGPDAIKKARDVMLAELTETAKLLEDHEFEELKDATEAAFDKQIKDAQLGIAKGLIDSIDFSTNKITIGQEAYDSIIEKGAAGISDFTPTVDGFVWRGTVTTWMDVYKEMGEGSEEIAKYARDKVLDTYQELSDIFESSDAPGASQVNEWIRDGISASHFNATWDDFKDSTSKAAVEEIVMASAEESAEILGEEYVEGAKRSRAARIIKEKAEIAKDFVSDLIGSIDFKTGAISVDKELYKQIIESNPLMSGKFTEQFDSWDFDGTLKDFITYSQAAGAEITGSGKLIADAMEEAYESIESIFSSPEQIIKDTQVLKGFSSKMMAEVLMRAVGKEGTLTKDDNELWNVDGVAAFDLLAETLAEGSVNAYAFVNHLDESYKGMQGLARLESQMNAQHVILANEAEKGTDDYWNGAVDKAKAALAQMSAEYARLVFSSDTYDFMGNSLTNEKLAPMYTLMENLQGAQKTLVDASKNKGKLDIKSFHAMRDYINAGKKTSKTTTKLLDNIDTSLGPTMEVALDNDTIELLGQELNIRTREDVDTYNDAVKANNDFVDSVENSSEELSKAITFAGIPYGPGQEKTKFRDLAEAVYTSLPREESLEINRQALEYIKNGMPDEEAFATALRMSQKDDPQLAELTSIHDTIRRLAKEMGYDVDDKGKIISPDGLTQADHEKVIALTKDLKTAREEGAAMVEKLGRTEIKLEEVRGFLAEEIARGLVDNEASQAIIASLRENEEQNLTRIGELLQQITDKEARITALEKQLAEVIGENSEYWSEKKETGQKTQNQVSSDFAKGETQMAAVAEIERLKIAEKERLKQEQDAKDKENRIARIDRNEQDERDSNNRLERLALEKRLKDKADKAALAEELAAAAELIQPGPAPVKPAPTTPPDTQISEITTTGFDKAKDDFEKRKAEADAKAVADAEQMAKFEEKSAEFAAKKAEIEAKAADDAKQAEDLRRKLAISDRAKADTDEEVHYSDVELEKVEVLSKAETELNAKTAERAGIQTRLAEIYEGTEITLGRIQDDAVGANELIKNAPKEMMQEVGALLEELIKLDSSIEDLNKEIEKEKNVDITLNDADAVSAVKSLTKTETKTIIVKTLMAGTPTYMMASGGVSPGGNTLVGELGPETRVSNGKYSIVGKNGPETIGLKKDDVILNHVDTARIFGGNVNATGRAYSGGTPFDKVKQEKIDLGALIDLATNGTGSGKTKETTLTDFDRWYNFLNIISDVSDAINELQAARENLFGKDYTESQVREIELLEQQGYHVERFLAAQQKYKAQLETSMIAEFGDYVKVIDGVLQVKWEALTALEDKVGAPILEAISEWDSLTDSISSSTSELEGFRSSIRSIYEEMRNNYIDVELKVIEGIKYRQQLIIDNLQKELDMKVKYDNKYLSALRDNIAKERKLRSATDSEAGRATLQKKLALLQRDTSGKSDLAIAGVQKELKALNLAAYDQRQDDFVESEEDALVAAQEALQEEIEIQTEVLTFMSENTQLIQEAVNEIMESGPRNLASFLSQWDSSSATATPTSKQSMKDEFTNLAGQVDGYLTTGDGSLADKIAGYLNTEGAAISTSFATSIGALTAKMGLTEDEIPPPVTKPTVSTESDTPDTTTYYGRSSSKITGKTYTATSTISQKDADAKAKKKRTDAEAAKVKADAQAAAKTAKSAGGVGKGTSSNMLYAEGGLVDYTGPAIVHGSKSKPEVVLNPRQTSIFQNFTELLDKAFGQNMRAGMVQSYTSPSQNNENGPTVVVENITLTSGVIAKDYDARRAGDLVKEEILKIAKYQGGMSINRK